MKIKSLLLIFAFAVSYYSCSKDQNDNSGEKGSGNFEWKEEISVKDIPDAPVKGYLNGKEVNLVYINFEQWRGSGDNVINFGNKKPSQNCGYVEGDDAFHLMHKSGDIKSGEFLKSTFVQQADEYTAYFHFTNEKGEMEKVTPQWNCALVITSMEEKVVKGKIAMCFKDDKKSWIAGTFEAIRCYN